MGTKLWKLFTMTHEEFIKSYRKAEGKGSTVYFYPIENRWIGAHHISRQTGLSQEQFYKLVTGIQGKCERCESQCKFEKLSVGFSRFCSPSCRSTHMWEHDEGVCRNAVSDNGKRRSRSTDHMWKDPDFIYMKNVGQFEGVDTLTLYILHGDGFMKFGISSNPNKRIKKLCRIYKCVEVFRVDKPCDEACRLEALAHTIGSPYPIGILKSDGRRELRNISYSNEIMNLFNS